MEKENKRLFMVILILVLFVGMLHQAVYHPIVSARLETGEDVVKKDYDETEADVCFWYTDDAYTEYFQACARQFYDETGIAVEVALKDSLGFMETVYQTSVDDTDYPDVYMIQNDSLGKAYLYGVAAKNRDADVFTEGYAKNAVMASACGETMYGYPITFNTNIFIYQTSAFSEPPASIQSILDLAETSEIGLMAGNLLEWNVADEFYDFPFVGSSISFQVLDEGNLKVNCDEELYNKALTYYQGLADTIDLDTDTITRGQVLEDFNSGATLTAIIDSEDLGKITAEDYGVSLLPALNEELSMLGCSYTEMLVVNGFSEEQESAAAFAKYVTMECAENLEPMTGHVSVKTDAVTEPKSQIVYSQYENSCSIPNTMDVEEFLRELKNKMTAVWNGDAF